MQLIGVRERLLAQLDAVDNAGSSAAFQRILADELRAAEADSSPDSRWHRHLLRLMGDALARKTLSEHALFELAREMRPAPSLSAQGSDFDFVLDTAEAFARGGVPVVVSDLTHLVGVGGIVTVNDSNAISIIECKNRAMPDNLVLRGRHWRQQRRQADAAAYLSTGYLSSDGQRPRIALEVDQPPRRDDELLQCIEQAWRSPTGSATAYFGERDLLIACWNRGLPVKDVFSQITINQDGWRSAVTAGSLTACANPGPFVANPYSLRCQPGYPSRDRRGSADPPALRRSPAAGRGARGRRNPLLGRGVPEERRSPATRRHWRRASRTAAGLRQPGAVELLGSQRHQVDARRLPRRRTALH